MQTKTQLNGYRLVYSVPNGYWHWLEVINFLNQNNEVISEQVRDYVNPYLIRQGFETIESAMENAPQEVLNNLPLQQFPLITFMTQKIYLSQIPNA